MFGAVDVLVEAFDRADQKAMLAETFVARFPDKPVVAGSGMAGFGPANSVRTTRQTFEPSTCAATEPPPLPPESA